MINLPLWNPDETDVKPEFWLSYGHVLIHASVSGRDILRAIGYPDAEIVPSLHLPEALGNHFTYEESDKLHFLFLEDADITALFADRTLFFENTWWMRLSREIGAVVAVVTRTDQTSAYATVFDNGTFIGNAGWINQTFEIYNAAPAEYLILGEKYEPKEAGAQALRSHDVALLARDVTIHEEAKLLLVRRRVSGELLPSLALSHFYARRQDRAKRASLFHRWFKRNRVV